MYTSQLDIDHDILRQWRQSAQDAPGKFGEYVEEVVRPYVNKRVEETLALEPGPAVTTYNGGQEFEFATENSRRFYFANFAPPYERFGQLAESWYVAIDRRRNDGFLTIGNDAPYAGWVLGSGSDEASFRQVPGHANTGWAEHNAEYIDAITDETVDLLADGWQQVIGGRNDS